MALNFKTAALGIAALGIFLGVAFGAGVAYGRGDPKTVEGGLTQQQIQTLLGIGGGGSAQGASGTPATGGAAGAGARGGGAAGGGTAAAGASLLGANATAGRVTAVSGQSVTIQTAQGNQRVNLAASTSVNKMQLGALPDLREGLTIFATGTRNNDGSFEAASVTQLPPELGAVLAPAASATPAPGGR